ncbi:MAG: fumarate hydratase [Actinomycetia bacterium]|nr:fumarate hydratase [Actinomycetes bacterium]
MLQAADIAARSAELMVQAACQLRPDVREALEAARAAESNERAREVLGALLENDEVARRDGVPICQDTGTTWIHVELAAGEQIEGDLQAACDAACAAASKQAGLRDSLVADAYHDRRNTATNTPVFVDVAQTDASRSRLQVMLKGAGSDNASRIVMLDPDSTDDDIEAAVLAAVREKASMACPPLIVGIGIGGTFDTVAKLSKRALLRPLGAAQDALARRLLAAVNATGIGPAALGGDTTALAVLIETAPSHIAAKPLAINLCCNALRSASCEL